MRKKKRIEEGVKIVIISVATNKKSRADTEIVKQTKNRLHILRFRYVNVRNNKN
jgi:hypothetical protein